MKTNSFSGKIFSQPIVVPMKGHSVVFVVIKTRKSGRKKFYCTSWETDDAKRLYNTPFSDVIVSSIGDIVRFEVATTQSGSTSDYEIISFENYTQKYSDF